MKRRRTAENVVVEVAAAALDDDDTSTKTAVSSLYKSEGYVVIRDLFPPAVLRWLRLECDTLSESVDLIDADCMVDPLDGIEMDNAEVRCASQLQLVLLYCWTHAHVCADV